MTPERWERVKAIFSSAIALADVESRERYVRGASPDDPEVCAEVLSLLEADSDRTLSAPAGVPTPLQPITVGPYRVIGPLGRGGMGEVFLADDSRLHRKVALKALQAQAGDEATRRILREARAAARLDHPSIARVYDVIEHDGRLFMVMEYANGETLNKMGIPLAIDRATAIASELADALAYAHEAGVVHGDVKPANVIVTATGRLKLLDLGVARVTRANDTKGTLTTEDPRGIVRGGTPAYMAPEQWFGATASERSDIYSLGVILFELLAGRRPFVGDDAIALATVATQSTAPRLEEFRPGVPVALASLVSSMLSRDPAGRPSSAAEVRSRLASIQGSPGGRDTGATTMPVTRRRPSLRVLMPATLLLTIAAIGLVWTVSRGLGMRGAPAPVLVLPALNLSHDDQLNPIADTFTSVLAANLAATPGMTVVFPSAAAAFRTQSRDPRAAARKLGAGYAIDVALQKASTGVKVEGRLVSADAAEPLWTGTHEGGTVTVLQVLLNQVATAIERSGAVRQRLNGSDQARMRSMPTKEEGALNSYARARSILDTPVTLDSLSEAVTALQVAISRDPNFVLAETALVEAYGQRYAMTRDPHALSQTEQAAAKALELAPRSATVHSALARVYQSTSRTADALRHARLATELAPDDDDGHRLLGRFLARSGRIDEAKAELTRAIALRPDFWGHHYELGFAMYRAGRYAEAIQSFRRVTELQPESPSGFAALGTAYHKQGDVQHAIGSYEHALRLGESAGAVANLGFAYYQAGQYESAVKMYARQVELDPSDPTAHRNIADVYLALRRPAETRQHYTAALRIAERRLKVNPRDASLIAIVAICEAELGRASEALRHAAEAETLAPADNDILFNVATVMLRTGRKGDGQARLTRAIALGYPIEFARHDPKVQAFMEGSQP
jgi:serine/threonine-protein kinase